MHEARRQGSSVEAFSTLVEAFPPKKRNLEEHAGPSNQFKKFQDNQLAETGRRRAGIARVGIAARAPAVAGAQPAGARVWVHARRPRSPAVPGAARLAAKVGGPVPQRVAS